MYKSKDVEISQLKKQFLASGRIVRLFRQLCCSVV